MEKIKLVIWDLDETFWEGTLSEEKIQAIQSNLAIVKALTDRGIMNSIASKNDFQMAKQKLESLGIWEYFIFPSISWNPKGELVAKIIEKCQLRAPNVLFLDDNHLNLEEVKFYNQGIHVHLPEFIPQILDHQALKGKDDSSHSRLKQYKLLEERNKEMIHFADNVEFLRHSNIQIDLIEDLIPIKERIHELINRTNQLNFTKVRLAAEDVEALIENDTFNQGALRVKDRFGDYGIVGYYCLDPKSRQLIHFVFSCRILNLGIEQFMYTWLDHPHLEVVGEVVGTVKEAEAPDWIEMSIGMQEEISENSAHKTRILFKGGCDLSQMLHYLSSYNFEIINETNYVAQNNFPIHTEHTQMLLDTELLSMEQKNYLTSTLPFIDEQTYESQVFEGDYDILIYSLLMDYTQELYEHQDKSLTVPFGGYADYLTDTNAHEHIVEKLAVRNIQGVDLNFLETFSDTFTHKEQITPHKFIENLQLIREKLDKRIPIIFINGSELPSPNVQEAAATRRHIEMNKALDQFVAQHPNCYTLDVREIIYKPEHITNNIRHYHRAQYRNLAEKLLQLLLDEINISLEKDYLKYAKQVVIGSDFVQKSGRVFRKLIKPFQ